MEHISLIHLRSVLNDSMATILKEELAFLNAIDPQGDFIFEEDNRELPGVFFIQTGGAEVEFLKHYKDYPSPYLLLVTGRRNSLAASLEILSFLQSQGLEGKILFGDPKSIHDEIASYVAFSKAKKAFQGCKLGVIGKPSDWLIASNVDYHHYKEALGVEIVDVPYEEFLHAIDAVKEVPKALVMRFKDKTKRDQDLFESLRIYMALKALCIKYRLGGFTLRCFDLLTLRKETSCLAFGLLNEEGIIAGCEGDVPVLVSMSLGKALFGEVGFMANPSDFNLETNTAIYAHCTCPFSFVKTYTLNTHFESGLGFGIQGDASLGAATCFKINADGNAVMALEGDILSTPKIPTLCRTQIEVKFKDDLHTILNHPHGNHMIFHYGYHKAEVEAFLAFLRS